MLFLLSPSKTLDFETPLPRVAASEPHFKAETAELIGSLKRLSPDDIKALMDISDKLAALNAARFKGYAKAAARPALFAFKGDVYEPMDVYGYSKKHLAYAGTHLRILSGLYGLLAPLDEIKPHRLEMGTMLPTKHGKNLVAFWGDKITRQVNATIKKEGHKQLINLASQEYFAAIQQSQVKADVITIHFKENKGGSLKTIGLFAKQARGRMADFAIKNMLQTPEDLKAFNAQGYRFQPKLSDASEWVFARKHAS